MYLSPGNSMRGTATSNLCGQLASLICCCTIDMLLFMSLVTMPKWPLESIFLWHIQYLAGNMRTPYHCFFCSRKVSCRYGNPP